MRLPAAREGHVERAELLLEPPDADAEVDSATGQDVEVGDVLRRAHGVALWDEADAGAEADPIGHGREVGRPTRGSRIPTSPPPGNLPSSA